MKIDNSLNSVGSKPTEENRSTPANGKSSAGDSAASGVNVDLSPLSAKLQSIEETIRNGQVADPARVNEIKQAIADGRFKVNPEVVADRLLATVQELIRAYRA